MEVYNHVCRWLNGKGDGLAHWNATLKANPATLAFAVDDAHMIPQHPVWNGGWIMVNTASPSATGILDAIRRGNYYSTCGPRFDSITFDGQNVHIRTSPVQYVRMVGPGYLGKQFGATDGRPITDLSVAVPTDWDYVYLEIEDERRGRAWTNTLFSVI